MTRVTITFIGDDMVHLTNQTFKTLADYLTPNNLIVEWFTKDYQARFRGRACMIDFGRRHTFDRWANSTDFIYRGIPDVETLQKIHDEIRHYIYEWEKTIDLNDAIKKHIEKGKE